MNAWNTPIKMQFVCRNTSERSTGVPKRRERNPLAKTREQDLVDRITAYMSLGPFFFYDIVREFPDQEYRDLLRAWSTIRSKEKFERDAEGHYILGKTIIPPP